MSSDIRLILEIIPSGKGLALDLGGGGGALRYPLVKLGYQYLNLDLRFHQNGEPSLLADAHALPFKSGTFDLVVSKDTLEHFQQPWIAVKEVHDVLNQGGLFILWVPFMHGFHGNDLYRYTPLGLQYLLSDFEIVLLESPLCVFTVVGSVFIAALTRISLGFLERPLRRVFCYMDECFFRLKNHPSSIAAGYRLIARKK